MTGVPLNIDWQQILLHLFNFTILFGCLYILLYKPVKNFMQKRTDHYSEMDQKAEQTLAEAESEKSAYEQKQKEFSDEMKAVKSKMGQEVEAEKIVSDARVEAEREKNEIIASAQKEITDMVTEAMEKLTLEQTASDAFDQFLDAAEEADK